MRAYALTVKTPPVLEPLTLDEAKAHLRVDGAQDDATILSYVKAARDWYERQGNRACITQVLQMRLDYFPAQYPYGFPGQYDFVPHRTTLSWLDRYAIWIPRPPLVSVASLKYVDTNGVTQTLDPTLYQVSPYSEPGRVCPAYGQTWPVARAQMDAVTIEYTAGWGIDSTFVPEIVRQLLRLVVAHHFDPGREPYIVGKTVAEMPHGIQRLFYASRALVAA